MTTVVVDASVVIKWFVPEAGSDAARRLLAGENLYAAPDLLFVEVANVAWKKVRRGHLSERDASQLVSEISNVAIAAVPCRDLAPDAYALAHSTGQTVYDSMYLALALRLDTFVVTADERFVRAAAAIPALAPHLRLL